MLFYKYLFLFALFSIVGWILELIYRSIITKKLVNPGFMSGCVVPIYGVGAIIANLICILVNQTNFSSKIFLVCILSMIFLSFLELICGYVCLKYFHLRLWDYRKYKINYKGYICLNFSLLWAVGGVLYYILVFPYIDGVSTTFINTNIGIFLLGMFLGIFIIDLSFSIKLLSRLIKYAKEIKENIDMEKIKLDARINIRKKKFFNAISPYLSTNRYLRDKINEIKNK